MMFEYFLFLLTMSITPGPNTIRSMANGAEKGLKGVTLNLGMLAGISLVTLISYALISLLSSFIPKVNMLLQILGVIYLVYLGIKMLNKRMNGEGKSGGFVDGFLMQIMNVKVLMLAFSAISLFVLPSQNGEGGRWLMLISLPIVCFLSGLVWAVAGAMMRRIYEKRERVMNIIFSSMLFILAISNTMKLVKM